MPETPTIRVGRPDDLDELERLETSAFASDRLSRRSLRYFLRAERTAAVMVAARAGTGSSLAGYAMVGFRRGSSLGRLFSLAVDPAAARQGLGRSLLAASEAAARSRGSTALVLEVRQDNAGAISLYETSGYARFALLPSYYEDGTAAIRLRKPLPAAA